MRVSQSLPAAGIGLAVLAAFGFAGQPSEPQQGRGRVTPQSGVWPTEQITVDPVHFAWSDLVAFQASLPKAKGVTVIAPDSPELPLTELSSRKLLQDVPSAPSANGVENLAPCAGYGSEPSLGKKFDGQLDGPDGAGFSFIPADVTGSVGPDHVMTMLNNKTLIQDRLGGAPVSVDTSVFWSPLGATPLLPTNTQHRVNYDAIDGRWLASCKNGPGGANSLFFAISATNNPTGLWTYYSFLAGGTADWITQGYNQTWIALGAEVGTSKLWVIEKATALAGGPLTTSVFGPAYPLAVNGAGGTRWTPTRAFDTSSADMYLVAGSSFIGGPSLLGQMMLLTGTGPAPVVAPLPSLFAPATSGLFSHTGGILPLSQFQLNMQELGEATRNLNAFSLRMAGAILRNGRVWIVQSMGAPGTVGNAATTSNAIVWMELDPALMPSPIVQGGGITGGPGTFAMFPSIAVNCGNDVVIGFSSGSATIFPRACYTMRLGTDALGAMGPIRELKAGESSYWKNFAAPATTCVYGRWSATTVDPIDDKAFWTCQTYADTRVGPADNDSRWGSHWGRIGSCGAPSISVDPVPTSVCVGGPASFSVSATPFVAPIAYQWRKDGVDISGATSSSYSIPSTVALDGGTYDVVVEDGCGSMTSLGALLDFTGAVVTTQPANQNVQSGDVAGFFIVASGTGTITYQWSKNGVPINGATSNLLLIPSVGRSDIGLYDCVATDACGPGQSSSAVLSIPTKVKGWAQESVELTIFKQPESAIFCVGSTESLSVVAFGQNVSYVWRKGFVAIVPPETNSTLVLSSIGGLDAGTYDCVVLDDNGVAISDPAVITVNDVATINVHPTNVNASLGDMVSFSVTATGDGTLTYQWKKGGLQGPLFNINGSTDSTHEINSVNNSHAGRYQCAVSNLCGTVLSNTAKLTIVL